MSYYTGGNILSVLVFFVWIPIALYGARRWPPAKTMAYLFLGGLLLLPEVMSFKPPGLPAFSKHEIVPIWIFVGAWLFHRQRLKTVPRSWWFRTSIGILLVGSIFTIFLNPDGIRIGTVHLPGQVPYDAVHAVSVALLTVVLPFYLGAAMFRSSGDLRVLLTALVVASILYSPLQFIEMWLSPQLHNWVYGFAQHDFIQTMRGGGYRPMVFMAHGLALALFTVLAVLTAAALHKSEVRVLRFSARWAMLYLWVVLILSNSTGSLLYSLVAVPLVFFAAPRTQSWIAIALVAFLLMYPVGRVSDLIPVENVKAWAAEEFGEDRAASLTFRFENEAKVLDRAMERPWFGWGTHCRACLFDPWSGDLESTRDGEWIIQLSDFGIIGFIGKFSFLLFPLLLLVRRIKYVPNPSDRRLLSGLALMIGFASFDLIPNADYSRLVFVLSGALWGCLSGILQRATAMRHRRALVRIAAAKEATSVAPHY